MPLPSTIPLTLQTVGLTSTLLYTGFGFCASSLVAPLIATLPAQHATVFFRDFFYNGAANVIPFVAVGVLSSLGAAYTYAPPPALIGAGTEDPSAVVGLSSRMLSVLAAVTLVTPLVWTQAVMMPVNNRLIELSRDAGAAEKAAKEVLHLLGQWRWMNFVRAGLGLGAGVLGMAAVTGQVQAA